jgi:hexosaminidase
LESWYVPADAGAGTVRLRLVNAGRDAVDAGFELTFTTVIPLDPVPPATLVRRLSGSHVVAPPAGTCLEPGATWELELTCAFPLRHANDGPESAYLTTTDGTTRPVRTGATALVEVRRAEAPTYRPADASSTAWHAVAERDRRLHPDAAPMLSPTGEGVVELRIDPALGVDEYVVDGLHLSAGSEIALQRAITSLPRGIAAGRHTPRHEWRGLHIDLARQFLPAADVNWLIDVAAWHGLNRLHLHLTDDEGWRVPVDVYPALTDVGAWRGDGLPIPALLGSGSEPYGGAYTREEIAVWVEAAGEAGVILVPEVDLPGHCFAALAACPELAHPDDTSGAVSVQWFVDNVLNPGVAGWRPFVEAVFGSLADMFPSPWLHAGGDELPPGAWRGSPAAQRTGIDGAGFVREIVELIVATTGRQVGVWQEAAEAGAVRPGDGYVVGWKSASDCRRLAADGFRVVAAPAEVFYLDMAADTDWHAPGMSWAGHTSVADIEAVDVGAGWSELERNNLLGVQACLWTEHVHDRPALERLLFPRLAAFAAAT